MEPSSQIETIISTYNNLVGQTLRELTMGKISMNAFHQRHQLYLNAQHMELQKIYNNNSTKSNIINNDMCHRCGSLRSMEVRAKCKNRCLIDLDNEVYKGHVPENVNLDVDGDDIGNYIGFYVCADCGHMDGDWPLADDVMPQIHDAGYDKL